MHELEEAESVVVSSDSAEAAVAIPQHRPDPRDAIAKLLGTDHGEVVMLRSGVERRLTFRKLTDYPRNFNHDTIHKR